MFECTAGSADTQQQQCALQALYLARYVQAWLTERVWLPGDNAECSLLAQVAQLQQQEHAMRLTLQPAHLATKWLAASCSSAQMCSLALLPH